MRAIFMIGTVLMCCDGISWSKDRTHWSSDRQLRQVIQWATSATNLNPDELSDAAMRARQSAAIPDVHLRYAYDSDVSSRASLDSRASLLTPSIDSTRAFGDEHRAEVGLRWQLSRLRFHPSEARLLAQKFRRTQRKQERARRALRSFIAWERATISLRRALDTEEADSSSTPVSDMGVESVVIQTVDTDEIEKLRQKVRLHRAELDLLTNGRFSSQLASEVQR